MSFYLGKDTNNKAVMHITKGYRTSDELRDGILGDTVFHSDLPYVQYSAYQATIHPLNANYTNANYGLSIPEAALNELGQYSFSIVVEHSGKIELYETYQPNLTLTTSTGPGHLKHYSRFLWTNSSFDSVRYNNDSSYQRPALLLPNRSEVSSIWVVIYDTGISHTTNTSETVFVGKGRLDVDGTSLATYRYVTSVPVNDTDPIVYTPNGGSIQFVNFYSGAETSLSITSNNGRSVIRSSGKNIFDSGVARGKVFFDKIAILNFPGKDLGKSGDHDRLLATDMQDGDLFTFLRAIQLDGVFTGIETNISMGVFRPNTSLVTKRESYTSTYSDEYSLICTGDGRLIYRYSILFSQGTISLPSRFYVTHYK